MVKLNKHLIKIISFLIWFGWTTTAITENTLASTLQSSSLTPSPVATTALLKAEVTQPIESSNAENINLEIAKLLLEYLKVAVWPIVTIYLIHLFKSEVKALLEQRLTQAEILGNKFVFQTPSQEAPPANPKAKVELSQVTPKGFLTAEGIRNIVSQSNLLPSGEQAISQLLLFDNSQQHTWIVASPNHVFIVLDDSNTRSTNQLIQTVMNKKNVLPLQFRSVDGNAGVAKFGSEKPWWYYSLSLFPTPSDLENSFQTLLSNTKNLQ